VAINVDPIIVQLGPLALRWYGLMYVVGIAVGLWVAIPYTRALGLREEQWDPVIVPAIVAGLVGERLYFVVQSDLGSYLRAPWRILEVWQGGMAFYGAVIGAVGTIVWVGWRRHLPIPALLDVAALFAAIGQAFGRIGNIVNGDIIGPPTTLPWGVVYANPHSFAPAHDIAYQPAAAYELLFNLLLIALLWRLRFRFRHRGLLFTTYLATYSLGQIILFTWRSNDVVLLGLKQAQVTALVALVLCVPLAWLFTRQPPEDRPQDGDIAADTPHIARPAA